MVIFIFEFQLYQFLQCGLQGDAPCLWDLNLMLATLVNAVDKPVDQMTILKVYHYA